jgi:WD40 repeat protein/Leucine-rich repeat (LRR) protein
MESHQESELSGLGRALRAHKGPAILLGLVAAAFFWARNQRDHRQALHDLIRSGARAELVEGGGWLYDLDFRGADIGERELRLLAELPGVRSLDVSGTSLGDDDLPLVLKLRSLMDLDLSGTRVSPAGVSSLRKVPGLYRLDLARCALADDDLAVFARFPALADLRLSGLPLTDAGLHHLAGCRRLERLDLSLTKITDAGMPALAALPHLRELDLGSTGITDAGLEALRKAAGLDTLKLRSTKITDQGLALLPGWPALRRLDLASCKVTDAGMRHLAGVSKLSSLALDHTPVGDAGVAHLRGLPLRKLTLSYTGVTDKALSLIGEMSALQHLEIEGMPLTLPAGMPDVPAALRQMRGGGFRTPAISDAGLRHLKGLRGLQVLRLRGAAITDAGAEHLVGLAELRKLGIGGTQVGDAGLSPIGRLAQLRELDLGSTPLAGPGLAALTGLQTLRTLSLDQTRVGDAHLPPLQELKNLTDLNLSRTDVTDAGLAAVGRLTGLARLWLDGTAVTDAGLGHLRPLSRLRWLGLTDTRVTDAGLEPLRELPALQDVNAYATAITAQAAKALLARTPPLRVVGPKETEAHRAPRPALPDWKEELDPARVDALGDPLPKGARARLGTDRLFVPGGASRLALTPDGGTLLASGNGPRIFAFDTRDGRLRYALTVPDGQARAAALSPDGRLVAACVGGAVRLWDAGTGHLVRDLRGGWSAGLTLTFAPDGRSLAVTAYPGGIRVLGVETGRELLTIGSARRGHPHEEMLAGVTFSPDGKALAVAITETTSAPQWREVDGQKLFFQAVSYKPTIRVYGLPSGKVLARLAGAERFASPGTFADRGRLFLTSGDDKTLLVYDTTTWQPVRRIPWVNRQDPVALPDGRTVLERDGDGWRKWDVLTGRHTGRFDVPGWLVFSADGKVFATAEGEGQLSVYNAATFRELVPLDRQKGLGHPRPLAYSPDGKTLATAGSDETIRLWDVAAARTARTIGTPGWSPSGVSWSPDGKRLSASLFSNGVREKRPARGLARVWDAASGRVVFETPEEGWRDGTAISPCLSANGLLAVGRSVYQPGKDARTPPSALCTVLLYDTHSQGRPRVVETKGCRLDAVALSRDGRLFAWADEGVAVAEAASGRVLKRVSLPAQDHPGEFHPRTLLFSPDGKRLAVSAGAKGTLLVDCATGDAATQPAPANFVPDACLFTGGGRLLVAGKANVDTASGSASDVAVWDAGTGKLVRPAWRTEWVSDMAFAPGGSELATARAGAVVLLWPLAAR